MLAKSVMQGGIDIDNRIQKKLDAYKQRLNFAEQFEDGVLNDILEDVESELITLFLTKKNIEDIIDSFHRSDVRQILRMHYLKDIPFPFIADDMCMDEDEVKRLHHKALKRIDRHLERSGENDYNAT
ncbi:MAG: hypothetical protein LUG26_07850 [Ruminococcus sp.]|nr:hypothetical protein [Ruminococcus sp.]